MKNFYLFLFVVSIFCITQKVSAQNISNEGSDFWLPFPTHDPSGATNLANMVVSVACKKNSIVTVSCGSYTETQNIVANTIATFNVPRANSYINATEANTVLTNRAIHVVTAAGQPDVSVYAHVYASARSAASLILPKGSLGQKYYSMNYTQDAGGRNFLVLVASEDNTNLIIHENAGTTRSVSLVKAGDVYEYYPPTTSDLTGTFVEVAPESQCKTFAAFSGSTSIIIACTGSRDPLIQQLYTINSWGKNYGIVPFSGRKYILRILAQEDGTNVQVNGTTVVINKGKFYETAQLTTATIVKADKLVSVAQYSLTQACSSATPTTMQGDPEMVLLNPIEFNIKNVTVYSPKKNAIVEKYLNVFMKTDKTGTFKLDGVNMASGWTTIPGYPEYSFLHIAVPVDNLSLTLTADDGFNAMAYGFGQAESYAYSAGTNLASSQFLTFVNKSTSTESSTACLGESADFKLTLPYLLTKIVWKFTDGTADFIDNNPVPTTTVINGETLYIYTAPVNKTFNVSGPAQITANASIAASAGSCAGNDIELIFNFNVDPLPTADFAMVASSCAGNEVSFTDKSISNIDGKNVNSWQWDFGDGSPFSTVQNPKHTFNSTGIKTVKLTIATENGCFSNTKTLDILVNPKPTANFIADRITCVDNDVTFTDKSEIIGGNIVKWTWDFDDATSATNTSDLQNPIHKFAKSGTYNVKLIVESDKGCISSYSLPLVISDLPKVDFSLPEVCMDAALAVFKNNSTDFDGATTGLIYAWDFGDTEPGSVNNTSSLRDGSHTYSLAKMYTVTLTVTNANGCKVVKTQQFTVNSSNPVASFEKDFAGNVCSSQSFKLKNTSTVPGIGKITRLEWYFDGILEQTDEDPMPNQIYTFNRPKFTSPLSKDIVVTLKVFTGDALACSKTSAPQTVKLLASPEVTFNALDPICFNGGKIQLVATEIGNLEGDGFFSGSGISSSGMFNPLLAGIGKHTIRYTFNATNGCSDFKEQEIEVYPVPIVNAGADFYILAGGEKKIEASAKGTGLTYQWTPSIGLSDPNILNPVAKPEFDTRYTLKVTSSQGCTLSDEVYIHVLQSINAPNSFTPNGDGINDVWNIKYLDTYPNGTVEIFDRNGQRVYVSGKGYTNPFDGTYRNQQLPVGTYYYIINPNSGRKSITGNLTIIR
ncbi:MAG: PKD domain-containing protein [Pedobacter sp.]|nr:MAG: PKD domain-containing protein [Pedobacter sp.]